MSAISELESELARLLPARRRPQADVLTAARRWSEAVWTAAAAAGPGELSAAESERGLALGARPVFVCGVHRSGTTLVRDLLDAHPSLAVLPSEGSFRHDAGLAEVGREWVRRLANPINQPPYWLLGRSGPEGSPYVDFARLLAAWWGETRERPLVAVALAYASCRGLEGVERWVEKTPGNERRLDRLCADFPAAKVVQVVRHPMAVLASRKRIEEIATGAFRCRRRVLKELVRSYEVAAAPREGHWVLRYEDLVADVEGTTDRLAAFLGIAPLPELRRPTVAGQPAFSNSSFASAGEAGLVRPAAADFHAEALTAAERRRLAARVGASAAGLGYRLGR
jgi:hypothetical protein